MNLDERDGNTISDREERPPIQKMAYVDSPGSFLVNYASAACINLFDCAPITYETKVNWKGPNLLK